MFQFFFAVSEVSTGREKKKKEKKKVLQGEKERTLFKKIIKETYNRRKFCVRIFHQKEIDWLTD